MPSDSQTGDNDRDHAHEFYEYVQRRAGSIFKRVAHGISYDSSLMAFRPFAAVVALLDIFLRIIPGTSGICHKHCEHKTARKAAYQPKIKPTAMGATMAITEDGTISRCAPFVEISTHFA